MVRKITERAQRSATCERGEGARCGFAGWRAYAVCHGFVARTLRPSGSIQVLKSAVVPQVPPPPVGHPRQPDPVLWVRSSLLLEEPDRLVTVPEQRVSERRIGQQIPL